MSRPLRVMFVCTANVSRSPYAENRARAALGDAPVEVVSAGVPGYPGRGMDPAMADLLVERGVEPGAHVSRAVGAELMERADVVLTFEYAQHLRLLEAWPEHAGKVFGLRQFADAVARLDGVVGRDVVARAGGAAEPDSMAYDVGDPYGRGPRTARSVADAIDAQLDRVLPALADGPVARLAGGPGGRGAVAGTGRGVSEWLRFIVGNRERRAD